LSHCGDGNKALEILKNREISLLVTDMKMPGMNGLVLLQEVRKIAPNSRDSHDSLWTVETAFRP